ncbi:thermopsin family protease [Vulcanisaeta souniana]|uniref:Uncharacterized protein n=1 Tax=Vulcanisaeta souniana JCM 11219 TaxID=1293586 RepID=A0A830E762_9CREN|nr:thermopsin family protease [Vulcanisaeta souniana]BDR93198.1 hypothetical protein Vsou_22910 [Vulcanisaeta souniana JCM 11219]GGI78341.1 hypothetical protein GCM10007112_13980 [Vulcanisaeta souniana JCM 11219]
MRVLKVIGLAILTLFLIFIIGSVVIVLVTDWPVIVNLIHEIQGQQNQTPQPQSQPPQQPTSGLEEITNNPVGLGYTGPPTTALAGYYCINNIQPQSYSIQLNAQLSNGYWIQDVWAMQPSGFTGFGVNVWVPGTCTTEGNGIVCNTNLASAYGIPYYGATCAWLVIAIKSGTAYFGYSLDGVNVNWYYSYPVGNVTIITGNNGVPMTNIVIGGPGANQYSINLTSANVVLALYYWNGTTWLPAPSIGVGGGTAEYVSNAWLYWSNGIAVVSWPQPINQTPPVPAPGFTP